MHGGVHDRGVQPGVQVPGVGCVPDDLKVGLEHGGHGVRDQIRVRFLKQFVLWTRIPSALP